MRHDLPVRRVVYQDIAAVTPAHPSPYEAIWPGFKHNTWFITRPIWQLPSVGVLFFLAGFVQCVLATSIAAQTLTIVAFGDSLTAGLGVSAEKSFPARLEAALKHKGHDVTVLNAGVSGDTTAAGLARLDWAVGDDAAGVIVALGANDALRGLPPSETEDNLDAIIARITARDIPVLVAGMLAPPNMGSEYAARFNTIFAKVTESHGALFYPFFLHGVAANPDLNQSDGMHPNPEGVDVIVENILPVVEKLIAKIKRN